MKEEEAHGLLPAGPRIRSAPSGEEMHALPTPREPLPHLSPSLVSPLLRNEREEGSEQRASTGDEEGSQRQRTRAETSSALTRRTPMLSAPAS